MKLTQLLSAGLLVAAFSFTANAGLVTHAVSTNVGGQPDSDTNGSSIYQELNAQNKAYASLTGAGFLPTLKVMAQSSSDSYSYVRALALQKFTYHGNEASTFLLNFNLHGDVNSSSNYLPLRSDIGILKGNNVWFYETYDFPTNFFEGGLYNDTNEMLGYKTIGIENGLNQNVADSLSFDIQPGESFFVYAQVSAEIQNGFVDAWNTLTMSFADSTGLTAASSMLPNTDIPEPASALLLFSALALMARRKTLAS
ncbi:hypothetical protein GCM10009111_19820 [Colwellia asteriadis]|uniref:PEP-CTERM protein-sorting domain-containing protein n=1 Tax=Colwellia asteriadis TaxID=517723 RepID=A0ABN1L833_9GAMM